MLSSPLLLYHLYFVLFLLGAACRVLISKNWCFLM